MRTLASLATLLLVVPTLASAQRSTADLQEAMRAADAAPAVGTLLSATNAALNLRDYEAADAYLEQAWDNAFPMFNGLVNLSIMTALSSGDGVVGAQRAFRDANQVFGFSPLTSRGSRGTTRKSSRAASTTI